MRACVRACVCVCVCVCVKVRMNCVLVAFQQQGKAYHDLRTILSCLENKTIISISHFVQPRSHSHLRESLKPVRVSNPASRHQVGRCLTGCLRLENKTIVNEFHISVQPQSHSHLR